MSGEARLANFHVFLRRGVGLDVIVEYPDCAGNDRYVMVGLTDVRAADDIRISYDKERNGWLVEQQRLVEGVEVAFLPAYQFEAP